MEGRDTAVLFDVLAFLRAHEAFTDVVVATRERQVLCKDGWEQSASPFLDF